MTTDISNWICERLISLIGIDNASVKDICNYMMSFTSVEDLTTFTRELMCGNSDSNHLDGPQKDFLSELQMKWQKTIAPENVTVYKKNEEFNKSKSNKKNIMKSIKSNKNPFDLTNLNVPPVSTSPSKKTKKKANFVSLYGKDGVMRTNTVILPGRNTCECQAQKHKLINNCLNCGRVVCEQEGSGPCLFCGELVCTREEKDILARNSNKSIKLRQKLEKVSGGDVTNYDENVSSALAKARAYRNRLLDYDRSCAQRTKVIDDESDYYSTDSKMWLSEKERKYLQKKEAEIREKRHGSRLNKKFTIDFAGREVVEDSYEDYNPAEDPEFLKAGGEDFSESFSESALLENFPDLVNPTVKGNLPVFVSSETDKSEQIVRNVWTSNPNRLQDKQLLEMSDPGMCLSMHQPWASLLISGVKKDEGRSWYSNHRGRLWIAATAKKPSPDEIASVEEQHRHIWEASQRLFEMPEFPKSYPVGCLLGCVDVKDVLSQEDYIRSYPHGESGAAYVFVCENPHELTVKFPVKGKHKIWRLEPKTHKAAKGALLY